MNEALLLLLMANMDELSVPMVSIGFSQGSALSDSSLADSWLSAHFKLQHSFNGSVPAPAQNNDKSQVQINRQCPKYRAASFLEVV